MQPMADKDAYRLIHACFNSLEQATILLKAEPSLLNERTGIGETPLHYLAVENQLEAVQFLHQQGADLNTCDNFGDTPLMHAVGLQQFQIRNDFTLSQPICTPQWSLI
jgi:ankyrin repeat protein